MDFGERNRTRDFRRDRQTEKVVQSTPFASGFSSLFCASIEGYVGRVVLLDKACFRSFERRQERLETTAKMPFWHSSTYVECPGPNSCQGNTLRHTEQVHYQGQFLSVVRFFSRHVAG